MVVTGRGNNARECCRGREGGWGAARLICVRKALSSPAFADAPVVTADVVTSSAAATATVATADSSSDISTIDPTAEKVGAVVVAAEANVATFPTVAALGTTGSTFDTVHQQQKRQRCHPPHRSKSGEIPLSSVGHW